jgi:hypothetical protein
MPEEERSSELGKDVSRRRIYRPQWNCIPLQILGGIRAGDSLDAHISWHAAVNTKERQIQMV